MNGVLASSMSTQHTLIALFESRDAISTLLEWLLETYSDCSGLKDLSIIELSTVVWVPFCAHNEWGATAVVRQDIGRYSKDALEYSRKWIQSSKQGSYPVLGFKALNCSLTTSWTFQGKHRVWHVPVTVSTRNSISEEGSKFKDHSIVFQVDSRPLRSAIWVARVDHVPVTSMSFELFRGS